MDLTVQVPDELLCEVFSYVTSVPDKFKLAAVNQKFRRCMRTVLSKPMRLEVDLLQARLNGHKVPTRKWAKAVGILSQLTKFNGVRFLTDAACKSKAPTLLDDILRSLLMFPSCLTQVTSFEVKGNPCNPALLQAAIVDCPKLSILRFEFYLTNHSSSAMDLTRTLNNKPLTQLKLQLDQFKQYEITRLFQEIRPNTLERLDLTFESMAPLAMNRLISDLADDAWSALQEIRLSYDRFIGAQLVDLYGGLSKLLALRYCHIWVDKEVPLPEYITAVLSLFKHSDRPNQLSVEYSDGVDLCWFTGCAVIDLIHDFRDLTTGITAHFSSSKLNLAKGNVSAATGVSPKYCDERCIRCHSFYPNVIDALKSKANEKTDSHLEGYQLDRCRINTVVPHLNEIGNGEWWALTAEVNEGQDCVSIAFECQDKNMKDRDRFYVITVDCGQCFTNPCVGCMIIA